MRVSLLLTCLCDALYGEVGIATVAVLEHAGCQVDFDERQTCCGQPPYNSGDWAAAREIAEHTLSVFPGNRFSGPEHRGDSYLVTPSTSCAAMIREGYRTLLPEAHVPHCYELAEFLIRVAGVSKWPLRGNVVSRRRRVAFHKACHSRGLAHDGFGGEQERLLAMIPGLDLVPIHQAEQCCGFGGAFSATHGSISAGIGLEKLARISEAGLDEFVSTDMGCLMHLNTLIRRHGLPLRARHYAELLAEAL